MRFYLKCGILFYGEDERRNSFAAVFAAGAVFVNPAPCGQPDRGECMTDNQKMWLGKGAILLATLIWGSSFFILKNTIDALPTCFVLALRFAIAFLILILVKPQKIRMSKTAFLHGILLGVILACAYGVQTVGLKYTTPSKNSFLTATYTAMVPFLAWAFDKKRPNRYNVVAAVVCVIGVLIVSFGSGEGLAIGDALTVFSGLFYALQMIFLTRYREEDAFQLIMVELAVCAVAFSFISGIFELPHATISLGGREIVSMLYLAVFATCGTQWLQTVGQKVVPATQTSLILSLEAVFGTLFSALFYHEKFGLHQIIGFPLIFIAVIIGETQLEFLRKKPQLISPGTNDISAENSGGTTGDAEEKRFSEKGCPENSDEGSDKKE